MLLNDSVNFSNLFIINLLKNRKYDNLDELVILRDQMINLANDILEQQKDEVSGQ